MKKRIVLVLSILLAAVIFCGCEPQSNPLRATLTYSASNGDTGVITSYEFYDSKSAIFRATQKPLIITFNSRYTPEPVVDYEFYCPACKKKDVGKLFPPQSRLCVCNCEDDDEAYRIQAIVIKACFSAEALAETMPQYEAAESYSYFNTESTIPTPTYEAPEENVNSTSPGDTTIPSDETVPTESPDETVPQTTIGY